MRVGPHSCTSFPLCSLTFSSVCGTLFLFPHSVPCTCSFSCSSKSFDDGSPTFTPTNVTNIAIMCPSPCRCRTLTVFCNYTSVRVGVRAAMSTCILPFFLLSGERPIPLCKISLFPDRPPSLPALSPHHYFAAPFSPLYCAPFPTLRIDIY